MGPGSRDRPIEWAWICEIGLLNGPDSRNRPIEWARICELHSRDQRIRAQVLDQSLFVGLVNNCKFIVAYL